MNKQISTLENHAHEIVDGTDSYYHVLHRLYRNEQTVFIRPNDSFNFPANDLATLIKCKEHYSLIVNFLGLTGVDAPWWLAGVNIINRKLKIYRQVISQRCYELYYLAWYHTHPILRWMEANSVFPLSGSRSFDLTQFTFALRQLLETYPYRISESSCWETVAGMGQLGTNLCLGQNILLGERIVRTNPIIRITVGPLSREELDDWVNQPSIQIIINRLFARSIQTGARLCWQCRQRPLFDDSERCLGKAVIYLGF